MLQSYFLNSIKNKTVPVDQREKENEQTAEGIHSPEMRMEFEYINFT